MGKSAGRSTLRRVRVRRRLRVERLDERRVLAAITGAVFEDLNLSFQREEGESSLPRRLVFLDANQNATLDAGESVSVADADGNFRFENLTDGTYLVRLFNGTSSQIQTFPIEATVSGEMIPVPEALQFASIGNQMVAMTSQSLVIGDLLQETTRSIELGNHLARMQGLPDGRLLVVGNDLDGPTSWLVDPVSGTAELVDLDGPEGGTPWRGVALDGTGRGVLLEQGQNGVAVRAIDASRPGADIQITATSTVVPADVQAISSDSGNRSILAWADPDGLQLSLWSNVTASPIESSETGLPGAQELLAFDDASGLLAVRMISGDVQVHDVDAGFAPLHTLAGLTGPVLIDGSRELLVTVSPESAMLKLFSLREGDWIADLVMDLSAIGPVTSLSLRDAQTIAVLGAAGITEVALRKPSAREVTITGGQDPDPILFGVALRGDNTAPAYDSIPALSTDEDVPLIAGAPGVLAGSFDAEGDRYVLVQRTGAANGTAVVQFDGAISYTPDPNFVGNDSVSVLLHDGRDASADLTVSIQVNSVPDSPDILLDIDPIPENLEPGKIVGTIEIIDADGVEGIVVDMLDPRFQIVGPDIIFIGGPLDSVAEPRILVPISVTDTETGERIERNVAFDVQERNDPIRGIFPDAAVVLENASGGFVAFIVVDDGDDRQTHTVTVDDERFEIVGNNELRLVPGVSFDFETETEVTIHLTATENVRNGHSLTEPLTITVGDVPEQPRSIQLTDYTVMERVPGEVVGDVLIDGMLPTERFSLSVDDPRFEIVDGTLKLADGQSVEYANQSEIELEITVHDSHHSFDTVSAKFVIHVLENDAPNHNHHNPYDVDHSGQVTALDALAIINYLNLYGPGPVKPTDTGYCYDVNDDEMVTALDALLVLNEMNRTQLHPATVGSGEGRPEGEKDPDTRTSSPLVPPPSMKDEPSPVSKSSDDDVFGDWGSNSDDQGPADSDLTSSEDSPSHLLVDGPNVSSNEEFAESVDQTLRLLSDESS